MSPHRLRFNYSIGLIGSPHVRRMTENPISSRSQRNGVHGIVMHCSSPAIAGEICATPRILDEPSNAWIPHARTARLLVVEEARLA